MIFLFIVLITVSCSNKMSMSTSQPDEKEENSAELTGNRAMVGDKNTTDKFDQNQRGVLDILLVIDNTGSMQFVQEKLRSNLPDLLTHLSKSDWQIAVTGTKISNCVSARITKKTPDFEKRYSELVNVGAFGNGEYHFLKAIDGLKGRCDSGNMSWLRKSSSIAVVIVTDQLNECHDGYQDGDDYGVLLPDTALCKSSDLKALLAEMRPKGNAQVYGLLPSISKWKRYIAQDPEVIDIFKAYGSVMDDSYDSTLQDISKHVFATLENVFTLSHVPAGNVAVKVNDNVVDGSLYTIEADGNLIRFDKGYVPTSGSDIEVSYSYFHQAAEADNDL